LPEQPLLKALVAYRNAEWGYSLPRPDEWFQFELAVEGGQGVLFAPDQDDIRTALSVEVRDLGTEVRPEDLPDLERGFLKGLRTVAGSRLRGHESFANEFAIGVSAVQTFDEAGERRKRWVRLLYKGSVQARLIAQGRTVAEFDRLRPVFAPCMTTFLFGEIWGGAPFLPS
jgi:hypothetical protein